MFTSPTTTVDASHESNRHRRRYGRRTNTRSRAGERRRGADDDDSDDDAEDNDGNDDPPPPRDDDDDDDDDIFSAFGDSEDDAENDDNARRGSTTGSAADDAAERSLRTQETTGGRSDENADGGDGTGRQSARRNERGVEFETGAVGAVNDDRNDGENREIRTTSAAHDRGEAAEAIADDGADGARTGTTAGDRCEDVAESSSALTEFFSHLAEGGNEERAPFVSLKVWKETRKSILREYLTHRLIRPEDDDRENQVERAPAANDHDNNEVCSFTSDVLDGPFGCGESQPANLDANNDSGESIDEDDDYDDHLHLETQPEAAIAQSTPKSSESRVSFKGSASSSKIGKSYETQEDHYAGSVSWGEQQPESINLERDTQVEEDATPATDQSCPRVRQKENLFSGIKRKLGYHTNQPEEETASAPSKRSDERLYGMSASKRTRRGKSELSASVEKKKMTRGRMWDGRFESVVHVDDTSPATCSNLAELDLTSSALNLSLCRVLRVWDLRSTKRMDNASSFRYSYDDEGMNSDPHQSKTSSIPSTHQAMLPYEFFEDDGPLNTIYRRVFSIEIAQLLDCDNDGSTLQQGQNHSLIDLSSPSFTNMATAAFSDGRSHLERETSRKRRRQVRRIKLFFYNGYADAASSAFDDLEKQKSKSSQKAAKWAPSFVLSLANVPAECILPHSIAEDGIDPHLQQYLCNPFGDEEFGTLSPYCICVGDASAIRFDDEKLRFDDEDMKIRLVGEPDDDRNNGNYDAVMTAASTRDRHDGRGYFTECEQSELAKRYVEVMKKLRTDREPVIFNPEGEKETPSQVRMRNLDVTESTGDTGTVPEREGSGRNNISGSNTNGENDNSEPPSRNTTSSTATPGEETTESEMIAALHHHRPRSVVPLSNLAPLLVQNNMKRLKDPINVCGIVLGFSPPSLTSKHDWSMSISLLDETLPVSNQTRQRQQGQSTNNIDGNSCSDPKELHVPSITLVLFSKDKSKLPSVRSAGDVICCKKVVLQQWGGEPQLCAWRSSKVVIVRPRTSRHPGDELHDSISPSDYYSNADETTHDNLCWVLVNSLWRWGQTRLSTHPTMSPNCYLSIAEAVGGDNNRNNNEHNNFEKSVSGDLTAAVTAIISVPEHLRRRDTPRGYLRLWDGTGPSRTDPIPQSVATAGNLNQPSNADPPEEILIRIEKILRVISSSRPSNSDDNVIQAPIALCGRVVNAIIWEENLWNLIDRENMIDIGSFIRLRNISHTKLSTTGTYYLSVHNKSSLTPLPYDAYEIKGLLKGHATRIRRGDPTNPTSAILPANANNGTRNNRPNVDIVEAMRKNGLSMIEGCLQIPAPAVFTLQFEVSHTVPECNPTSTNAIKVLCTKKRDGTSCFRFGLHIKDASSEVDVLCLGKVAEKLLGITAQDLISDETSEICHGALNTLREIISPGSVWEGKVRSILGNDGKLYFVLKSMFCMTSDTI